MDQRKIFKALELIWLFSAGLSTLITVYFLVIKDTDSAIYFFFMFLMSGILYLLRRYQRKKQEEGMERSEKPEMRSEQPEKKGKRQG